MNDPRTLRDRQASLRDAIDAGEGRPSGKAPRMLVRIFDGGRMPTAPDHIFYGHPATLDCPEQAGQPCTPTVDTATTIPLDVLRHAPSVGDLLIATGVGGRWVAEVGGTAGTTKVCVSACNGLPLAGATIAALTGSTTVATCTTDATGCCSLAVPSGSYTVRVTYDGTVVYSGGRFLSTGGTTGIALPAPAGFVCCGGYLIPQVLTLTDAAGPVPFVYDPNFGIPIWTGGHSVTRASCPVTTPQGVCIAGAPGQGPVRVCYQMVCRSGQNPTFAVQRSWSWVYQQDIFAPPAWYQDPAGFAPGQFCVTAPPPSCGNPLTDTSSFGANATTAAPFLLAGTPAPSLNNATGEPITGGITITA